MKFVFTPDIIKYEEEFMIEADSLEEVFSKLSEEFPFNSFLSVSYLTASGLKYMGVVCVEEGKTPRFVVDHTACFATFPSKEEIEAVKNE